MYRESREWDKVKWGECVCVCAVRAQRWESIDPRQPSKSAGESVSVNVAQRSFVLAQWKSYARWWVYHRCSKTNCIAACMGGSMCVCVSKWVGSSTLDYHSSRANQKLQLPKRKRVYNQRTNRNMQCQCQITSSHDKTGFYLERGSDILALIK